MKENTNGNAQGSPKVSRTKETHKRGRRALPYPDCNFEEALALAQAIQTYAAGQKVRKLTLFEHLKRSPDSSVSRQLITNCNKYGLIKGGYQADFLELTPDGQKATSDETSEVDRVAARIKLAIQNIPAFSALYQKYAGSKLPAKPVLVDALAEVKISKEHQEQLVDLFIVNAKFLKILRTIAGSERILTLDHALEGLSQEKEKQAQGGQEEKGEEPQEEPQILVTAKSAAKVCFYITPIGEEGSEERKHSDLFLGSLIEPAVEAIGLEVIRADKIDKPGMITKQVIQYIFGAKLVIADLSYHNPNVFYELAIRHACRLPTVQIIRKGDKIPFDLGQSRTITIDCTDIYALVPKIETYRAEIANQVRQALADPDSVDNPITTVFPNIKMEK